MVRQPQVIDRDMVCVGQIATAHGVRGLVKLRSYTTDPGAIASYGPLTDLTGKRAFALNLVGEAKDQLLARIEGIEDRDAALALRGVRLYVPRARLPQTGDADEYYHVDLLGLTVVTTEGERFGAVVSIDDHGAGDVVEIARGDADEPSNTVAVPFTKACFPEVDLTAGRIVVDPPLGLLDDGIDDDLDADDGPHDGDDPGEDQANGHGRMNGSRSLD